MRLKTKILKHSNNKMDIKRSLTALLMICTLTNFAQPQNVDKVIAVVGKYIVLKSDYETQRLQYIADGAKDDVTLRCKVFEELLYQKLLVVQAEKDSVVVKDEQVDAEINRRMGVYLHQFGSQERFEAFYGKTMDQFKEELHDDVKQQLLAQQMQSKVVGDAKVSPAEIRAYYNSIPEDSLPLINSEVEIAQLTKKPNVSDDAKLDARTRLENIRQRVLKGESMSALAALYTEDPGSAKTGGRYDGVMRGQMVPEFDAIAFRLKPDEVSEVFETPFGYHFMQLIARKGEMVDVRHILMTPKMSNQDILNAKLKLDSIYTLLEEKKIKFCDAAAKYSDDRDTKNNCGTIVNGATGNVRFEVDELGQIEQNLVFLLDKMQVGDYTKPTIYQSQDSKQAYRIIYLKNRTEPHRANLKDDYQRIQSYAMMGVQKKKVKDWVGKRSKSTYIKIDTEFQDCTFSNNWNLRLK